MDVGQAVLFRKLISNTVVSGVVQLAGRDQMVIDQDYLVRVPELGKAHLLKFVLDEGDENVVDHHPVHIDGDNIAAFGVCDAGIPAQQFFNECRSHNTMCSFIHWSHRQAPPLFRG